MSVQPSMPREVSGLGEVAAAGEAKRLPVLKLSAETYARTQDCVRCGLCLPACPTYQVTGDEAESPRGRISLIKGLADGDIGATKEVRLHLDRCLDCRGCETACPSGVVYHELIEAARCALVRRRRRGVLDAVRGALIRHVLPYRGRVSAATLPVRVAQWVGLWGRLMRGRAGAMLPGTLGRMARLIPLGLGGGRLSPFYKAPAGGPGGRTAVAFLEGCAAGALFGGLNRKTVAMLNLAGRDVAVPAGQGCCGALALHSGDRATAVRQARRNVDVFCGRGRDGRVVVTNSAGCGAMLKQYAHLLRDDGAYRARAEGLSSRVRDVSEVLLEGGLPEPRHRVDLVAAYHDPCHHAHAQGLTEPPRRLLAGVPGVALVPLVESDLCCGAAGAYNLTQPEMADALALRKLGHLNRSGAEACVTSNVGCMMHLRAQAAEQGMALPFFHAVEVLYRGYVRG